MVKEKIRFCSKQDWEKFSLCFSKSLFMEIPFLALALLLSKDLKIYKLLFFIFSCTLNYYLSSFVPSTALCLIMYDIFMSQINNIMTQRGWIHLKWHNQNQGLLLGPTDAVLKSDTSDLATVLTSTQMLLMCYIKQELENSQDILTFNNCFYLPQL